MSLPQLGLDCPAPNGRFLLIWLGRAQRERAVPHRRAARVHLLPSSGDASIRNAKQESGAGGAGRGRTNGARL